MHDPVALREDADARIRSIVHPPAHCPGCLAEAGMTFPTGATTRHCPRCLDRIRRVYQCARWNHDHAHQVAAGHASWDAFSGLPPLSAKAVRRYVTPDMIRGPMGASLPEGLHLAIHRCWCAGQLLGVAAWLHDEPPPADSDGLWASLDGDPGTTGTQVTPGAARERIDAV